MGNLSIQTFISFAGVGAIATALQYILLTIQVELISVGAVLASFIAYAISSIVNYLMKYHYVFSSQQKHRKTAPRYLIISSIGLALNTLLMYIGVEGFGLHYLASQIIVTGIVLVWNYTASALWTFRAD